MFIFFYLDDRVKFSLLCIVGAQNAALRTTLEEIPLENLQLVCSKDAHLQNVSYVGTFGTVNDYRPFRQNVDFVQAAA